MRNRWSILLLSGAVLAAGPAIAATTGAATTGAASTGPATTSPAITRAATTGADWGQANARGNRATTALNMLEAQGDGQFTHFAASGRDFTADVTKNGQVEHVTVNPDTHQVQATSA